ncbi:MAG: MerR family transcriptional regulator [Hyphomicrobiaceae bacterium]
MQSLSIGDLARTSRVKVPTIRYYETIGLLPSPQRTEGRQRRYEKGDVKRLTFIRHARSLGFEVDAIRALLGLQDQPGSSCVAVDKIARQRLADVDARIASLRSLRRELRRMIELCGRGTVSDCRIIEALGSEA